MDEQRPTAANQGRRVKGEQARGSDAPSIAICIRRVIEAAKPRVLRPAIPLELFERALQEGLLSASQVEPIAQAFGDGLEQCEFLAVLAGHMPVERRRLLSEALATAFRIRRTSLFWREALRAVLARMDASDVDLFFEIVDATPKIEATGRQDDLICKLMEAGTREEREKVFREATQTAHWFAIPRQRVHPLAARFGKRTKDKVEKMADEVIAEAQTMELGERPVELLIALAEYLVGETRATVLHEALESAREETFGPYRARLLCRVADQFNGEERVRILREALAGLYLSGSQRQIPLAGKRKEIKTPRGGMKLPFQYGPEGCRALALAALASHLQGENRQNVLQMALEAGRRIRNGEERVKALGKYRCFLHQPSGEGY